MRVAIIDGSPLYRDLFLRMGHDVVHAIEDADFACFTGGEDVSPSLYSHPIHPTTYFSEARDVREKEAFEVLQSRGIPSVGICRGAQFLNVMSGGAMYQDCTEHTKPHNLLCNETGEVVLVTSTHHQMMKPSNNAIIIATASEGGERTFWNGGEWVKETSKEDIEVVYYPETRALCFQPHPEMMPNSRHFKPMYEYFKRLVDYYITAD